ncbi:TonB-dependent receptor [Echinicola sediminis]
MVVSSAAHAHFDKAGAATLTGELSGSDMSKVSIYSDHAERKISGKVLAEDSGEGLPGASVLIKGTGIGAVTDLEGQFYLEIPEDINNPYLVISFIGYESVEVQVKNQSSLEVSLSPSVLEEVVVVGYSAKKKADLTGSVATVNTKELVKQPTFQVSQALQGAIPGLTAIQSSGQPGNDGASLVIRGRGSFSASSSPLVLIDGVQGDINGLDANDIESISVLKDAGAAAIYGSRASNGVILVTTKRGKAGGVKVSYNGYIGIQEPTNQPKGVGALDYLKAIGDQATLDQYLANPGNTDLYPDTDWVGLHFSENGAMQYHNVDISGGSDKARVKATISYQDQDGNIPGFNFKRYQGRFNSDFTVNEKLDLSFDLNLRQSVNTSPNSGANLRDTYRQPAIFPAVFSDGRYAYPSTGGNPVAFARLSGSSTGQYNYFRGIMKAVYMPFNGLSISAMYSPEFSESYSKSFRPQFGVYERFGDTDPLILSTGTNNEAQMSQSSSRSFTDNFTSTVNYKKDFQKHQIEALAGYEYIFFRSEYFGASRYEYIIQDFDILDNGNAENDSNYGNADHNGLVSYFGRFNYNFDDRYLFTFNIRRDGSSRFAKSNRWGVFPSFSAGWNLHNEDFFPKGSFINSLKIRGSWGQLGNQSIGDSFPYASLIAIGSSHYANGQIQQGAAQQTLSNALISWETGESTNLGIDFSAFENKLNGSVEYYVRNTNDLLGSQRIPYTTGLGAPTANVYSIRNTGVDLNLGWKDYSRAFKYSINGNISTLKNEVTDLNGVEFIKGGSSITQIGKAVSSIYGYEAIGFFNSQEEIDNSPGQFGNLTPGDIKFKDQLTVDTNGDGIPDEADGVINLDDRVILGNSFPSISFGTTFNMDYKGFDLSLAMQGVGKRQVRLWGNLIQPLYNAGNIFEYQLEESWREDNQNANYPVIKPYSGASNNSRVNSVYVFDASYLRLRNITLGYSLPKAWLEGVDVSTIRVFTSAQNLLTFSKMPPGIDPLIPNDSEGGIYPIVKTYTLGINVSF